MKSVSLTDIGSRRKINQDYHVSDEKNNVYIMADGIGGYANGEVASSYASERLHRKLKHLEFEHAEKHIRQMIYQVNGELVEYCNNSFGGARMGTTILGVKVFREGTVFVSVGDTNLYGIKGNSIAQINKAHVFPGEELKRVISSALGPDCLEKIDSGYVDEGFDYLLLCTDGLNKCVSETDMLEIIRNSQFEESVKNLVDAALEAGGGDNITVMLLDMRSEKWSL